MFRAFFCSDLSGQYRPMVPVMTEQNPWGDGQISAIK